MHRLLCRPGRPGRPLYDPSALMSCGNVMWWFQPSQCLSIIHVKSALIRLAASRNAVGRDQMYCKIAANQNVRSRNIKLWFAERARLKEHSSTAFLLAAERIRKHPNSTIAYSICVKVHCAYSRVHAAAHSAIRQPDWTPRLART
jgi:hypothetical protein